MASAIRADGNQSCSEFETCRSHRFPGRGSVDLRLSKLASGRTRFCRFSLGHQNRLEPSFPCDILLFPVCASGEMADTPDLGSGPVRGGGSSPLSRTLLDVR